MLLNLNKWGLHNVTWDYLVHPLEPGGFNAPKPCVASSLRRDSKARGRGYLNRLSSEEFEIGLLCYLRRVHVCM